MVDEIAAKLGLRKVLVELGSGGRGVLQEGVCQPRAGLSPRLLTSGRPQSDASLCYWVPIALCFSDSARCGHVPSIEGTTQRRAVTFSCHTSGGRSSLHVAPLAKTHHVLTLHSAGAGVTSVTEP